jgi:hypothetical protein
MSIQLSAVNFKPFAAFAFRLSVLNRKAREAGAKSAKV